MTDYEAEAARVFAAADTEIRPLSLYGLTALRDAHHPALSSWREIGGRRVPGCAGCGTCYPCDTLRLVTMVLAARAALGA